jgi:hypothetical protein
MVMQRVERPFRPGQVARGRLTIANDGNVRLRYAVEVSTGVTAPGVGFVAEETAILLTDVVPPGRSATVRIPLALPPDIAEGRKVVRVRIGEAGPGGELVSLLDEEFFSGLLRVEVPRPVEPSPPTPAPAPPIEAMPLPGEVPRVVGHIVSVESPQRGRELQGGQRATVRVTYENTGSQPHAFSVIAWAGELAGPAQIDPDVQGTARGTTIIPGARGSLEVSLGMPQEPPLGFGSKDVLVMLADLDPTGRFPVAVHDSRGLPSLFTLAPPPAAPPTPPAAPQGLLPGDLVLGRPTATPNTLQPGDIVTIRVPFTNVGPLAVPISVDAFILDAAGDAVLSLPRDSFTPPVGMETTRPYTLALPADLAAGSYGLQVLAFDPNTVVPGDPASFLIRQTFHSLFTVVVPEVAPPPAPAGLAPGNLDLLDPVATPAVANPGQAVAISLPFFNAGPVAPPIEADVFILGPQGTAVATLPRLAFAPDIGVATVRTVRWTVPQAAAPGSYGVQVYAWDPNTFVAGYPSTYLVREQVLDVFTVEAVPAPPPPPEELVPEPGDLGLPAVTFTPSAVEMGRATQGSVSIPNLADFPFTARITVSLIDSAQQGVQTVVMPTDLAFNPLESRGLSFSLDTGGLEPDTYGLRVVAVDPFTGTTLMDRNIPGGLQVTVPAALRGVNEFSDIRWAYDGVPEPPDPRILRLGPPPPLPIVKAAGAPTGGFVVLRHWGEGGRFNIGYGIAASRTLGHNDPFRFFIATESIPPHPVATDIVVAIPQGPWPSAALAPSGRYDALKFIDNADTRQTVYSDWDEDVFEVP